MKNYNKKRKNIKYDSRRVILYGIAGLLEHQIQAHYIKKLAPYPYNEIGMFISFVDAIDITGKTTTADALLTQRTLVS
ncbi:hypothetical protein [Candidatus Endoriftia persephone]|uniref:Uncharacterized protein n=1 Tax=Candidatus Endoriftia persephonae TaxID=393765 RepID=A0A9J7A299_9GAMM|nr:hypothetical protein [Candidatus Endoriftia persephone]USF89079.1 hypothetical protein L0Y14_07560 [Candidatus Endoriftia persephone]